MKQFPCPSRKRDRPGPLAGTFNITVPTTEDHSYEELEDEHVFQDLLVEHEDALCIEPLLEIWEDFEKMGLKDREIDWDA